jgi:hypothetical protein
MKSIEMVSLFRLQEMYNEVYDVLVLKKQENRAIKEGNLYLGSKNSLLNRRNLTMDRQMVALRKVVNRVFATLGQLKSENERLLREIGRLEELLDEAYGVAIVESSMESVEDSALGSSQ